MVTVSRKHCHLPFSIQFTSFLDSLHFATRLTSATFQCGHGPIRPVMYSCCLSASGLCFLRHLIPTGGFCIPYGQLTRFQDSIGITTFRICEMQLRRIAFYTAGIGGALYMEECYFGVVTFSVVKKYSGN